LNLLKATQFDQKKSSEPFWTALLEKNGYRPKDSGKLQSASRADCPGGLTFPLNMTFDSQDRLIDGVEIPLHDITNPEETKFFGSEFLKTCQGRLKVIRCMSSLLFQPHGYPLLISSAELANNNTYGTEWLHNTFEGEYNHFAEHLVAPILQTGSLATDTKHKAYSLIQDLLASQHGFQEAARLDGVDKLFPKLTDVILINTSSRNCWVESFHSVYEHLNNSKSSDFAEPAKPYRIGWGCITIHGVSEQSANQIARIAMFMLVSFTNLKFFRDFLLVNTVSKLGRSTSFRRPESIEGDFARILLAYELFVTEYRAYRAIQPPKHYNVLREIEHAWHIDDDITSFRESIATVKGVIEEVTRRESERHQRSRDIQLQLTLTAGQSLLILLAWNTLEDLKFSKYTPPYLHDETVRLILGYGLAGVFFVIFYLIAVRKKS
jgi:hypothetical protein